MSRTFRPNRLADFVHTYNTYDFDEDIIAWMEKLLTGHVPSIRKDLLKKDCRRKHRQYERIVLKRILMGEDYDNVTLPPYSKCGNRWDYE